jgi:hypothetical protein
MSLDSEPSDSSGIGLFFSAFMICLTWVQARYTGISPKDADEFNSASRSVKPGLIASAVVSSWTWAATLVCEWSPKARVHNPDVAHCFVSHQLQSSAMAYKVGISGPWWYAAGATVQVLLFAQVRERWPSCTCEVILKCDIINSSPPNSSSTRHMHIHSSKSLMLDGEGWPTWYSCFTREYICFNMETYHPLKPLIIII